MNALVGSWNALRHPKAGMIIRVREACLSGEAAPVQLGKGAVASVSKIDGEDNIVAYFPSLVVEGESDKIIVLREDFCKFERLVMTHEGHWIVRSLMA